MTGGCRLFRRRLHALVEGEIGSGQAVALRLHAARCVDCEYELKTAESVAHELRRAGLDSIDPPEDLVTRVMTRLPWAAGPDAGPWRIAVGATLSGVFFVSLAAGALAVLWFVGGALARPLLPGLHSTMVAVVAWLGRFGALVAGFELPAALGAPGTRAGAGHSGLAGLLLMATGLLGTIAALSLGAARAPRRIRHRDS